MKKMTQMVMSATHSHPSGVDAPAKPHVAAIKGRVPRYQRFHETRSRVRARHAPVPSGQPLHEWAQTADA
jgi:hypothetical protein